MGERTNISWADSTWNPVTGCSHVSPGCEHCYAEALSLRFGWSTMPWTANHAKENVVLHPERLDQPLRWKKPRRVFVNSMSDLFHEQVPDNFIDQVFSMMAQTPQHSYLILTKRPERMRTYIAGASSRVRHLAPPLLPEGWYEAKNWRWPLEGVWLGVSVEDQRRADERIPLLLETPAAVRFLSCEPLLGEVDLTALPLIKPEPPNGPGVWLNALTGIVAGPDDVLRHLDWVICGGESGPKFRPMDMDWARAIRDQCIRAGVPFFFKQTSGPRPSMNPMLDGVMYHGFPIREVASD